MSSKYQIANGNSMLEVTICVPINIVCFILFQFQYYQGMLLCCLRQVLVVQSYVQHLFTNIILLNNVMGVRIISFLNTMVICRN